MAMVKSSTNPDVTFNYNGADGTTIVAYRWNAVGTARAVVQLAHGMGEHALRYNAFARILNNKGYVVYAQDHRGHGATAKSSSKELGQLGSSGWTMLVKDIHLLVKLVRAENHSIPLVLLGHSMGSFAVQQYILDHSAEVDAVVLTGTTALDLLRPAADLDQPPKLSAYNAAFQPARTDFDWLSRDESVVDAYIQDSLCGFGIDAESAKEMYVGAQRLTDPKVLQQIRSNLPVLISVGDHDPINNQLKSVEVLVERFRTAGLSDLTVKDYHQARHEVLNETNRNEVINDMLTWIECTVLSANTEKKC